MLRLFTLAVLCVCVASAPAAAGLITYEGFDIAAANGSNLAGQSGATSFGWGTSWTTQVGNANEITVQTSGLTLGTLRTSAGAALVTSVNDPPQAFPPNSLPAASRTLTSNLTTTFYASFLFQNQNLVQNGVGDLLLGGTRDTTAKVALATKEFGQPTGFAGERINNISVVDTGTVLNSTPTTYLMIAKIVPGTNSTVTNWVLTGSQFDAFKAAGSTEAYLNTNGNVLQTGSETLNGFNTSLTTTDPISVFGYSSENVVFDELRIGTALTDVTPSSVPEPSGMILSGLAASLLGFGASIRCWFPKTRA